MELTFTEDNTKTIFQRLANDVDSLKRFQESQNLKLELCSTELQTKIKELQKISKKLEVKSIERETLRSMVSEEKKVSAKKTEEIKGLTEELEAERAKTKQIQQSTSQIQDRFQNENRLISSKVDTMTEVIIQLNREKQKLLNFLASLGNEVNFQEAISVDIVNKLFQHIQRKIRSLENDRKQQQFGQGINKDISASTIGSVSNMISVSTFTDTSTEPKPVQNPTGSKSCRNLTSSSSSTRLPINKKDHGIDKKFNKSYACRCICGKFYKQKQSLLFHIRTFTEKLPFYCSTCNVGFIHKYRLTQHLKSANCILAKQQHINMCTDDEISTSNLQLSTSPQRPSHQPALNGLEILTMKSCPMPIRGGFQVKRLLCPQSNCSESFLELTNLKKHLENMHAIKNLYLDWGTACNSCGKLLKDFDDLKQHRLSTQCTKHQDNQLPIFPSSF